MERLPGDIPGNAENVGAGVLAFERLDLDELPCHPVEGLVRKIFRSGAAAIGEQRNESPPEVFIPKPRLLPLWREPLKERFELAGVKGTFHVRNRTTEPGEDAFMSRTSYSLVRSPSVLSFPL